MCHWVLDHTNTLKWKFCKFCKWSSPYCPETPGDSWDIGIAVDHSTEVGISFSYNYLNLVKGSLGQCTNCLADATNSFHLKLRCLQESSITVLSRWFSPEQPGWGWCSWSGSCLAVWTAVRTELLPDILRPQTGPWPTGLFWKTAACSILTWHCWRSPHSSDLLCLSVIARPGFIQPASCFDLRALPRIDSGPAVASQL